MPLLGDVSTVTGGENEITRFFAKYVSAFWIVTLLRRFRSDTGLPGMQPKKWPRNIDLAGRTEIRRGMEGWQGSWPRNMDFAGRDEVRR